MYNGKTSEIPISTDGGPPKEPAAETSISEDLFDEFVYDNEALEEAEGYFTEGTLDDELFENPRTILGSKVRGKQKDRARGMLLAEKGIFANGTNDLGQTDVVTHEIDTGNFLGHVIGRDGVRPDDGKDLRPIIGSLLQTSPRSPAPSTTNEGTGASLPEFRQDVHRPRRCIWNRPGYRVGPEGRFGKR
ncbi:5821_t:CDS:2, partial [Dentiscutata heterogama]